MDHCAICKEEINLKDLNTTNLKSNGVMPINIQLEPLFEDKKKEQNVLKLFLLAFQEIPTILYIKTL
jgi:hypothetical protein